MSWKAEGGTAIHLQNAQGKFYLNMLEEFFRQGAGRMFRYWYNYKIVAMDLCIEGNGSIIALKTTYELWSICRRMWLLGIPFWLLMSVSQSDCI
jgi:hypothetical protein